MAFSASSREPPRRYEPYLSKTFLASFRARFRLATLPEHDGKSLARHFETSVAECLQYLSNKGSFLSCLVIESITRDPFEQSGIKALSGLLAGASTSAYDTFIFPKCDFKFVKRNKCFGSWYDAIGASKSKGVSVCWRKVHGEVLLSKCVFV